MTITFTYANDCTENFKTVNGPDIEAYVRAHNTFAGQTFDNARILWVTTSTSGHFEHMTLTRPKQWWYAHYYIRL